MADILIDVWRAIFEHLPLKDAAKSVLVFVNFKPIFFFFFLTN